MSEDRIDAIEQRLDRVERQLALFQSTVVKKLTEALQLIQKHQKLRDTRVNSQLREIASELAHIRKKLADQVPPVMN